MNAPLLSRALELCVMAHRGQWRKGARVPYAVHPLRVVGRARRARVEAAPLPQTYQRARS